jgi:hypothetical protein
VSSLPRAHLDDALLRHDVPRQVAAQLGGVDEDDGVAVDARQVGAQVEQVAAVRQLVREAQRVEPCRTATLRQAAVRRVTLPAIV